MSFAQIYMGTLAVALVGDRLGLLHASGKSCFDSFPSLHSTSAYQVPESSAKLVAFSLLVLIPVLALWRRFWKHTVFAPLADACVGEESPARGKFMEQAWLSLHYTLVTLLGYYVLQDKPWWPAHTASTHLNAPLGERTQDQQDVGLQVWYATQLAFYALEFLTLVAERETRKRSDVVVYFFHHVYTVLLLAGSWLTWNHRIGTLVLFLHDIGDIFLPIGKCFTYSEPHVKRTKSKRTFHLVQFWGIFFFAVFIVAFAVPRLFVFGRLIYLLAYDLDWTACCGVVVDGQGCVGEPCPAPFFNGLLASLLMLLWPMHVFWMWLISKMAVNVVFASKYQDVRSDDEEEGEQTEKKASPREERKSQ